MGATLLIGAAPVSVTYRRLALPSATSPQAVQVSCGRRFCRSIDRELRGSLQRRGLRRGRHVRVGAAWADPSELIVV
jgi:hypothetical protein